MSTTNDVLAHNLAMSKRMVHRFADDLTPQEMLHRITPKTNCIAWIIGHLALTDRMMLKRTGVAEDRLPELPAGFEQRFSRDEGCPQAAEFGDTSTLLGVFDKHHDMLTEQVKKMDAKQLDAPLEKPFPPMFTTMLEMISFMSHHTAMHSGQFTIILRHLGKQPVV
jgi:hypothetical protein